MGLAGLSAGLSGLAVWGIYRWFSAQLLDMPNQRSSHTRPTPRGGGLGFILAFAAVSGLAVGLGQTGQLPQVELSWWGWGQLWAVLLPLAIVGLVDDRRGVSARVRYGVQLLAATLAVISFGPFPLFVLGGQFGLENALGEGGAIALPFLLTSLLSIIAITALINFTNFVDGLDGIVAGVGVVQFSFFALFFHQPIWGLLAAALLGFLRWNWHPAKIFMGDVGSTVLGGACGVALLSAPSTAQAWSALAITLPIVADAVYTLVRRLLRQENIFQAHRFHLYQRLQQAGWSHGQVAATWVGGTVAIALLILSLGPLGSWLSLGLSLVALGAGELYLQRRTAPQI